MLEGRDATTHGRSNPKLHSDAKCSCEESEVADRINAVLCRVARSLLSICIMKAGFIDCMT